MKGLQAKGLGFRAYTILSLGLRADKCLGLIGFRA